VGALDDTIAVITGAGGGIGAASARLFAREGAAVALVDVQAAAATTVGEQIADEGGTALVVPGDLTAEDTVRDVVAQIVSSLGGIDVVFNNAGVALDRPLLDTSVDEWDHVMAVNLRSAFLMIKHAAPHMGAGGSIINQASVAALMAVRSAAAYTAAKGGLVSLTRVAAAELGPAIRVNCICPGTVRTQMPAQMLRRRGDGDVEAGLRATARRYLLERLGEPEEIASTALFLASPASSFFTGAVLVADGGVTAQ
jgi:NAD(P)-dependent dehydrogenase (short-subunit alcohol dehydrogenase family)